MNTKKFIVTNNTSTSICMIGRQRIYIPGECKDYVLTLPEASAQATVARLKKKYPVLKIKPVAEEVKAVTPKPAPTSTPAAEKTAAVAAKTEVKVEKKSSSK